LVRGAVLHLFGALVKNIKHCSEKERSAEILSQATEAAKQYFNHLNMVVRMIAIDLFRALFEHGQGFAEALQAAQHDIDHKDWSIEVESSDLEEALSNSQVLTEVTVDDPQKIYEFFRFRETALFLFRALVKNIKHCPDEQLRTGIITQASQAAKNNIIGNKDWWVRRAALKLFTVLFKYGLGFAEALQTALQYINHENDNLKEAALFLFTVLVYSIQYCPEELKVEIITQAAQASQQNINHSNYRVSIQAQELQTMLVKVQP